MDDSVSRVYHSQGTEHLQSVLYMGSPRPTAGHCASPSTPYEPSEWLLDYNLILTWKQNRNGENKYLQWPAPTGLVHCAWPHTTIKAAEQLIFGAPVTVAWGASTKPWAASLTKQGFQRANCCPGCPCRIQNHWVQPQRLPELLAL